jgi:hypothetical protein
MAKTVAAAFQEFRQKIEPPAYDRAAAIARRDRLFSVLSKRFEIIAAFPSGSIPRYTAVKAHSDLDILMVLHWTKHVDGRTPAAVLRSVRVPLALYHPAVRRDGQALTINYGSWPKVDVVPAYVVKGTDGKPALYYIPDAIRGVWVPTNPPIHDADMEHANSDQGCGLAFKRMIKMVKWWNIRHGGVLQSFHIETIALELFQGAKMTEALYPFHLQTFFKGAHALVKAGSFYHRGQPVDDYLTPPKRRAAVARLAVAERRANAAWLAGVVPRRTDARAVALWKGLFNSPLAFPSYA